MGYALYTLPDGRNAGYGVEAECDHPDCHVRVNRGLGYLCGLNPLGRKDANEPGCGNYYCEAHGYDHGCTAPECGLFPADGGSSCTLAEGHDLPHRGEDGEFMNVERPLLTVVSSPTEES
jgi:hypothetical protein